MLKLDEERKNNEIILDSEGNEIAAIKMHHNGRRLSAQIREYDLRIQDMSKGKSLNN